MSQDILIMTSFTNKEWVRIYLAWYPVQTHVIQKNIYVFSPYEGGIMRSWHSCLFIETGTTALTWHSSLMVDVLFSVKWQASPRMTSSVLFNLWTWLNTGKDNMWSVSLPSLLRNISKVRSTNVLCWQLILAVYDGTHREDHLKWSRNKGYTVLLKWFKIFTISFNMHTSDVHIVMATAHIQDLP